MLGEAATAVSDALTSTDDWGLTGGKPGLYRSDLVADEAALSVLHRVGLPVLSEESGLSAPAAGASSGGGLLAVVDPLDGSTNASRRIPWFATSLCVLDELGPLAATVLNLVSGARFTALRGGGAFRDGEPISTSGCGKLSRGVVGVSGYPKRYLGWKQFRALGAVALDLCAVADGTLDGYVDCAYDAHGGWDYLAGMLVCSEAGGTVVDALGRELTVRTHDARRTPVAGATDELCRALAAARRSAYEESSPGL